MTAAALCAVGAERVVSNELRKLGLSVAEAGGPPGSEGTRLPSGFGRVRFRSDLPGLYRALMGLRAADRVLLEAAFYPAEDFGALFEGARAAAWEDFIPPGMGIAVVKARSSRSRLKALTSIQSVVHKAAAERLCAKYKLERLPENGPEAELRVYVEKDQVSLLLDLSGEPLFKRGYRSEGGPAPLRETTAAALLLLAGWRRKFPLYDPFCGSGTILIEAAMYAWDMAPGLGRPFSLQGLRVADRAVEEAVRAEFLGKVNFERTIRIAGSDSDGRAVSMAVSNAERAFDLARGKVPVRGIRPRPAGGPPGIPGLPYFRVLPMEAARFPGGAFAPGGNAAGVDAAGAEAGFIITNPPYGKRLGGPGDAEKTYAAMAELRRHFPRWKFALITDHPGFESFFGGKADSCREITNGAVPSYFFQYERL